MQTRAVSNQVMRLSNKTTRKTKTSRTKNSTFVF